MKRPNPLLWIGSGVGLLFIFFVGLHVNNINTIKKQDGIILEQKSIQPYDGESISNPIDNQVNNTNGVVGSDSSDNVIKNIKIVRFSPGETMRSEFGDDAYKLSLQNNIELYIIDNQKKIILTDVDDAEHYLNLGYIVYAIVPANTDIPIQGI